MNNNHNVDHANQSDLALLEALLAGEDMAREHPMGDPSLVQFAAHLMESAPQAREKFRTQLEAQFLAEWDREQSSIVLSKSHSDVKLVYQNKKGQPMNSIDMKSQASGRPRLRGRMLIRWAIAGMLTLAMVQVLFPNFGYAVAQRVKMLFVVGATVSSDGTSTFLPTPPFKVYQARETPAGFAFYGNRYSSVGGSSNGGPATPPTEAVDEIIVRPRGDEVHIVIEYARANNAYFALFERAARPDEPLPPGEARTINNQSAVLQRGNTTLTLTWINEGTWIELESTLSEAESLHVAESLVVTQVPDGSFSAPPGLITVFQKGAPGSVEEAQTYVTFPVPTLTWVPTGLKLTKVSTLPRTKQFAEQVFLDYTANGAKGGIMVTFAKGDLAENLTYTGEPQEDIIVHGQPAKYTAKASAGMLEWKADGFTYKLTYYDLDLSRTEVQKLAESLR